MNKRSIALIICLGGCIGLALTLAIMVISSWGADAGTITINFNSFHEQLIETIIFSLWTLGGLVLFINLLVKRHCELK